jgi:hypothetical protein
MVRFYLIVSLGLLCSYVALARDDQKPQPISIEELNTRPVIGELGVPLGTVVEVDAVVVSGDEIRSKASSGTYLLKITHVGGNKLNKDRLMPFFVPGFVSVQLASNTFALRELKHGKKARSLGDDQIDEMEKGYVGKSIRLAVYEVGSFAGMPADLPEDVPVWQDFGFRFSTLLTVLAERDRPERSKKK